MKKIGLLLFVLFLDMVVLTYADPGGQGLPDPYFGMLVLFATLLITLLLFYDEHFRQAHAHVKSWTRNSVKKENSLHVEHSQQAHEAHTPLFKKTNHNLSMQYEFVDLVRQEIVEMRKNNLSDGAIVAHLKEEQWDPQVIYIALSRAKKGEKAK
jgi:hypothetical protein